MSKKAWILALFVTAAMAAGGCNSQQPAAGTTAAEETAAAAETTASAEMTGAEETTAAIEETETAAETAASEEITLDSAAATATVTLGDTEVVLAAAETFEDLDGNRNTMRAAVFADVDGEMVSLGEVESTSTAYPIGVKDGMLFTASHRAIQKTTVRDGELVVAEAASMKFGENDQEIYSYTGEDQVEAEDPEGEQFSRMFGEYEEAEIVVFE